MVLSSVHPAYINLRFCLAFFTSYELHDIVVVVAVGRKEDVGINDSTISSILLSQTELRRSPRPTPDKRT